MKTLVMTPTQAARHFGVSRKTVYRWARRGVLPVTRVNRSLFMLVPASGVPLRPGQHVSAGPVGQTGEPALDQEVPKSVPRGESGARASWSLPPRELS